MDQDTPTQLPDTEGTMIEDQPSEEGEDIEGLSTGVPHSAGGGGGEPQARFEQEDSWYVATAYFEEKGLVRQQLSSFDEFVAHTVQELVASQTIELHMQDQYKPGQEPQPNKPHFKIRFPQTFMARPRYTEGEGETKELYPNDARLRNLTYDSVIYVDIEKTITRVHEYGQEITDEPEKLDEVPIGRIPIMVRSYVCWLSQAVGRAARAARALGECEFDQGGYFIVNGVEKVLIAQEKMSTNHVYVFQKPTGSKHSYIVEVHLAKKVSFPIDPPLLVI